MTLLGGREIQMHGRQIFPVKQRQLFGVIIMSAEPAPAMLSGGAGGMGGVKKTQLFSQHNKH